MLILFIYLYLFSLFIFLLSSFWFLLFEFMFSWCSFCSIHAFIHLCLFIIVCTSTISVHLYLGFICICFHFVSFLRIFSLHFFIFATFYLPFMYCFLSSNILPLFFLFRIHIFRLVPPHCHVTVISFCTSISFIYSTSFYPSLFNIAFIFLVSFVSPVTKFSLSFFFIFPFFFDFFFLFHL